MQSEDIKSHFLGNVTNLSEFMLKRIRLNKEIKIINPLTYICPYSIIKITLFGQISHKDFLMSTLHPP